MEVVPREAGRAVGREMSGVLGRAVGKALGREVSWRAKARNGVSGY